MKRTLSFLAVVLCLVAFLYGYRASVSVTPTVDTSAYANGDCIGGLIELENAGREFPGTGEIDSWVFIDKAEQAPDLEVFVFDQNPTNGTYTDQEALTIHDDDLPFLIDEFDVASSDYDAGAGAEIAVITRGIDFGNRSSSSLWILLMADASTPTFTAADDLIIVATIDQD